jgi:CheY-like chemotaxis protein
MSGRTILLVEDEILIRTSMAEVLRDAGYDVTEACGGDEALGALAMREFDMLLTDVKMPGSIDGLELAARWRQLFPARPVLISSAHVAADRLHEADRLLTKPFADSELLAAVGQTIGSVRQLHTADMSY